MSHKRSPNNSLSNLIKSADGAAVVNASDPDKDVEKSNPIQNDNTKTWPPEVPDNIFNSCSKEEQDHIIINKFLNLNEMGLKETSLIFFCRIE